MFAQAYQSGFISVLSSIGSKPLQLWEKTTGPQGKGIRRVLDDAIQSSVIEITAISTTGDNDGDDRSDVHGALTTTWVRCPAPSIGNSLDIRLPHLVFQIKQLHGDLPFAMEVHVEDHNGQRRRFHFSTGQRATVVHELITLLPLHLDDGAWNQLHVDLSTLTQRAYGARYVHTVSIQIHAYCRVRRVFFAENMCAENEFPIEFRLYKRLTGKQIKQLRQAEKQEMIAVDGADPLAI